MNGDALGAWTIDLAECPSIGILVNKARFAVGSAILVRSALDAHPRKFPVVSGAPLGVADHSRSRPIVEPFDREPPISGGAGLFTLGLTSARLGGAVNITPCPQVAESDLRGHASFPNGGPVPTGRNELFAPITERLTGRTLEPVPPPAAKSRYQAPYLQQTPKVRMPRSPQPMRRLGYGVTVPGGPLEDALS
jgi:hypothetical protein